MGLVVSVVLIKTKFCNEFIVDIADSSCDCMLWLQLKHRNSDLCIFACVCYLPPNGSSRQINVHDFFDTLLAGIYRFQNFGTILICGDFNSRCGSNEDYIEGIDEIQEMEVIDFTSNMYGNLLLDFLINSNMCMLNG